jgi:hypothetical protein
MALEITESNIQGAQTLANIATRARELGLELRQDDIRFVLDIVSEADPWFEQGASANLFAGRFRNFVVARCRSRGLNLTPDELDLIDAWFTAGAAPARPAASGTAPSLGAARPSSQPSAPPMAAGGDRWWALGGSQPATGEGRAQGRQPSASPQSALPGAGLITPSGDLQAGDEFPRIVRTRLRG